LAGIDRGDRPRAGSSGEASFRPHGSTPEQSEEVSDLEDDLVIELAAAAGCPYIVTHKVSDFKGSESLGIRTITPAQALNLM
jgi:hypothetical protein